MWIEAWNQSPTLQDLTDYRESNEDNKMFEMQTNMNDTLNQYGLTYHVEQSDNYKIHLRWITNGKSAVIDVYWPIQGLKEANTYITNFIEWLDENNIDASKFLGSNAEKIALELQKNIEDEVTYLQSK